MGYVRWKNAVRKNPTQEDAASCGIGGAYFSRNVKSVPAANEAHTILARFDLGEVLLRMQL